MMIFFIQSFNIHAFGSIFEAQNPFVHFQRVENGAIDEGIFQCGHAQFRIAQVRHR